MPPCYSGHAPGRHDQVGTVIGVKGHTLHIAIVDDVGETGGSQRGAEFRMAEGAQFGGFYLLRPFALGTAAQDDHVESDGTVGISRRSGRRATRGRLHDGLQVP